MKKLFTLIAAASLMAACSGDVTTNRPDGNKQYISFSVKDGDSVNGQTQNAQTRTNAPWIVEQISQPAIETKVVEVETDFPAEVPLFLTITDEPFIRRTNSSDVTRGALLNSGDAAALSFGVTEYPTGATDIVNVKWENSHPTYQEMISTNVALFKAPQTWEYDAYDNHYYDFYAYAPWEDAGSGQGITLSENRQAITYDPRGVAANNHPDLMTAPKVTSAYVGAVPLTFHHRLCAVQIKTGGTWPTGFHVSSIQFNNIYFYGSFDIDTDKDADWKSYNGGTPGNPGPKGDYTVTGVTAANSINTEIAGDNGSNWVMMVPQTLNGAKLSITLEDALHNTSTVTAPINNSTWRAGHTITYTVSPEGITSMSVSYPLGNRAWSGAENGPVTSYTAGEEFGLFVVDKDGKVIVSNATATASTAGSEPTLTLPSMFYSKQYKYFLMYPKKTDGELSTITGANYSKYELNGTNSATTAEMFFSDVISNWSVPADQSLATSFKGSDLQIGMLSLNTFLMQHKMGIVKLQMPAKAVPLTKTLIYSTENSGSPTSTVFSTPNDAGSVSPSTDFIGNIPYSDGGSNYYYIVKSTGQNANTAVNFACNLEDKDAWPALSSGTDIGYGKYKAFTLQSERDCETFIALFSCVKTAQTVTLPWNGVYKMECWGANGGSVDYRVGSGLVAGGAGAYVKGQITLNKDQNLFIYVGEEGGDNVVNSAWTFNGGGGCYTYSEGYLEGRGGGATDIRLTNGAWDNSTSLNSRILVAAGGGGATNYGTFSGHAGDGTGAAAGGLIGYPSTTTYAYASGYDLTGVTEATGGTQTSAGVPWKVNGSVSNSNSGALGKGGRGPNTYPGFNAGGGSGWYGGASGGVIGGRVSSGAGGSSFISGHPGCSTKAGYSFSSTQMIDGKGKEWITANQTTGGTYIGIPSKPSSTGNGYAKITSL